MAEPFLSEIRMFSFVFPPKGWALCNGQFLPINQNQALFALLGTTYGGDGRFNFALPDFQGRTPLHVGSGHVLGQRGGEEHHTLNMGEMPEHSHQLTASVMKGDVPVPNNGLIGGFNNGFSGNHPLVSLNSQTIGNAGGNQAHKNMQPFLTISFCIALQGIFPSPS